MLAGKLDAGGGHEAEKVGHQTQFESPGFSSEHVSKAWNANTPMATARSCSTSAEISGHIFGEINIAWGQARVLPMQHGITSLHIVLYGVRCYARV